MKLRELIQVIYSNQEIEIHFDGDMVSSNMRCIDKWVSPRLMDREVKEVYAEDYDLMIDLCEGENNAESE